MVFNKLASAIFNDIYGGLRGYASNLSMSLEQLEDDIIDERLQIIKEYYLKGLVPKRDLLLSINCIELDCKSLDRCSCGRTSDCDELVAHFELPQILGDFGTEAIDYIGSTDRQIPFIVYTSPQFWRYRKYRKRGKNKPFVYVDMTPNENNMYDCWVFNVPILKKVSVIGISKNLNQLDECCADPTNLSFLDAEVKKRVTELKIRYYRQLMSPVVPNTQQPR